MQLLWGQQKRMLIDGLIIGGMWFLFQVYNSIAIFEFCNPDVVRQVIKEIKKYIYLINI